MPPQQPTLPAAPSWAQFLQSFPNITVANLVTLFNPPCPSESKAKSLLKVPPVFNGDKNIYQEWKHKLVMFLDNPKNKVKEEEQINIALSYMDGPNVVDWIQVYHNNHYNLIKSEWDQLWYQFIKELDATFLDS